MTPSGQDWSSFPPQPVGTDPVGNLDTSNFSSGSKECTPQGSCDPDNWQQGTGTASPKDDISNVYEADQVINGDLWGYFGVQRRAANGTTHYVFELNQAANHPNPDGISVPPARSETSASPSSSKETATSPSKEHSSAGRPSRRPAPPA